MDERDRRQTWNGFGDGLARAFEIAVTPALFGAFGWLIDRWTATMPVLTILFFLFAVIGMLVRAWYGYDAEMRAHEEAAPWARKVAR